MAYEADSPIITSYAIFIVIFSVFSLNFQATRHDTLEEA